ncbi:HET-domain-containing protein [Zopfia rhizophila CBS 207.26]|uniref:HET-domain-containing protein n=1 Tax=Zopfia rhizophila CBS 207.26 TaxID=1314779 RepID=A0A6A6DFX1_9PEZI|nr:HET-domain-containing protein [Zopfia rhizophila CBS 207.26]
MSLAKSWIKTCTESHDGCHSPSGSTSFIPTRLVEVLGAQTARLNISSVHESNSSYLTLSHCWGKEWFPTLTKENLEAMVMRIEVESLPRNFQDAICITFMLGYKYIRIDSLCIIQNSHDDWAHEAALMARVYHNSTLTIAAAAAFNAFDGCFRDRSETALLLAGHSFPDIAGRNVVITSITAAGQRSTARQNTLQTRGWVLQEELLSRRILHLTADGLFWECEEHSASELQPQGLQRNAVEDKRSINRAFALPASAGRPSPFAQMDPWGVTWAAIVRDFSDRNLTQPSDKLVALSGVASMMSQHFGSARYLAGLWDYDLLVGICWSSACKNQHTRPSTYRAPSWSWASLDGPVTLRRFHLAPRDTVIYYTELLDADITPAGLDPFGPVTAGYLKLSAAMLEVHVRIRDLQRHHTQYFISFEENQLVDWFKFRWYRCEHVVYLDVRSEHSLDGSRPLQAVLVPVFCRVNKTVDGSIHATEICFLLLQHILPVQAPEHQKFRRIGLVSVHNLGVAPDPFWSSEFPRHVITII